MAAAQKKLKVVVQKPSGGSFDLSEGAYAIEREALDPIGAEIVELPAKTEEEFIALAQDADAVIARNRRITAGIIKGLKMTDPDAVIVARQDALSESEGLAATTPMLQANPDLNAVLAIEETASEGAYQAFINSGHKANDPKVFIGGIDGTLRALQLLKQGNTMYRGSAALSLKQLGEGMAMTGARGSGSYHVKYTPLTPGSKQVAIFLKEWGK